MEFDPALKSLRQALCPHPSMTEVTCQPLTGQPRREPDGAIRSQQNDPPSDLLQPRQGQRSLLLDLRKRRSVSVGLDDVGLKHTQKHPVTLREVRSTPAECDPPDPWRRGGQADDDLVLHVDLAEELVIERKAAELALGQEVGDFGGTSLRILAEMPDERMLVFVVLKGLREVRSDDVGGMEDPGGTLPEPDLGGCDDLGRHDLRGSANHMVTEGVEVSERRNVCHARNKCER